LLPNETFRLLGIEQPVLSEVEGLHPTY